LNHRLASNFPEEDFDCYRAVGSNKSTANRASDGARVAIFAAVSTVAPGGNMFRATKLLVGRGFCPAPEGMGEMRRLGSLLSSAPTRIRRRLALIVAIAAASLPKAGA
jgi:hypothetical protein